VASAARMLAALGGLLLLGLAAAQALAPGEANGAIAPTLTVPTVSVPLPLPTVPTLPPPPTTTTETPQLPALTAPATTTTPSAPATTTPVGSALPPAGSALPPAGAAPPSGSASPGASGSEGSASRSEAGRSRARVSEVRARPIREERSKRRGVVLVFRLSEPDRVVFLVDGPTPACAVVARFAVKGREGVNRVRFFGVVRGRPLPPGTYLLRPRVGGAGPRGVPVTVRNGERPSAVPGPRDARCEERQAPAIFVSATIRKAGLERGQPTEEARGAVRGQEREEQDDERSVTPAPLLPPTVEDQALPGAVGVAILVLGAASLLFILGYVIRFVRAT
jgi:hypothetical protein